MWRPMAVSMIFGLLFATLILLFFVPNLYRVLFPESASTQNCESSQFATKLS